MKRGLLIIDRGSRQREASEELEIICEGIRDKGEYSFVDFCFPVNDSVNYVLTKLFALVVIRTE